jgi:hypothetical protein
MLQVSAEMPLVKGHLEAGVATLEHEASEGRYNTICIRALASVATVLEHSVIAERAARLLREAPDRAFRAGVITNIGLPKIVPMALRQIDPPAVLTSRYPPYGREKALEQIRSFAEANEYIAVCLQGRIRDARTKAAPGLRLEEVGDTLAVLGEFDAALTVARDPALENFRRRGVLLVLVIELYRSNRVEESQAVLAELEPVPLGPWERIFLALGYAGREPWCGYPYPDW